MLQPQFDTPTHTHSNQRLALGHNIQDHWHCRHNTLYIITTEMGKYIKFWQGKVSMIRPIRVGKVKGSKLMGGWLNVCRSFTTSSCKRKISKIIHCSASMLFNGRLFQVQFESDHTPTRCFRFSYKIIVTDHY